MNRCQQIRIHTPVTFKVRLENIFGDSDLPTPFAPGVFAAHYLLMVDLIEAKGSRPLLKMAIQLTWPQLWPNVMALHQLVSSIHLLAHLGQHQSSQVRYYEFEFTTTLEASRLSLATMLVQSNDLFAKEANLRVGNAPDTFWGGVFQTCRKLIDDGWIGRPLGATAFMMSPGYERWHPNPEFYYQPGGGPMFNMGPYITIITI